MNDTIAAIATAYGEGGIGIIRISGPQSIDILKDIFIRKVPIENRKMTFGRIKDSQGEIIDEVLAVYMKGPSSYTGEDVVEINCHGSMIALRKVLAEVLKKGARLAEAGEFTKRAFLNGRMDLSQAEAVIDVIKASSDKSYEVALSQMEGSLSSVVKKIRQEILDLLVDITVNIDYPEEDIEEITYGNLIDNINKVNLSIEDLISTGHTGRMIREGIRIAIVGKPNVGKSSLMNCLLKESRAIVTDIPGTTRDTIEEAVSIRGLPLYIIDTAGIRSTEDEVERIGIERTKDAFNKADFIIYITDGSKALEEEDLDIMGYIGERKVLVLLNKTDLGENVEEKAIKSRLPNCDIIRTALIEGKGIDEIEDTIEGLVYDGDISQKESFMINNVRHLELLRLSCKALTDALAMAKMGEALDIIEIDVRNAFDFMGEIIGETVSEEILNEVFSRFCLGK